MKQSLVRWLRKRRFFQWLASQLREPAGSEGGSMTASSADIEQRLRYLLDEVSDLRIQVRQLVAERNANISDIGETKDSFAYQWAEITEGAHLVGDAEFDREMFNLVERYTGLPKEWFDGKTVLDAGCGNGRWSFAFAKLGAKVTAFDQSASGVANLKSMAADEHDVTVQQADILQALPFKPEFDFVWSYGVCHHTGDTKRAVENVAAMVPPGGKLFLMLYGEPRTTPEFEEINRYVKLRRDTRFMTFDEKRAYLETLFPKEHVHGYFDAISPPINDLHRFEEIKGWLTDLGFTNVRPTLDSRNHHMVAERHR